MLREARRLDHLDASRDAEQAIKIGDSRLLGVALEEPQVPGVDGRLYDYYSSRYGVRFVARGCVDFPEWVRLRNAIYGYAERYNQVVLRKARK